MSPFPKKTNNMNKFKTVKKQKIMTDALVGLNTKRNNNISNSISQSDRMIISLDKRWNPYHWTEEKKEAYSEKNEEIAEKYEQKLDDLGETNPKESKSILKALDKIYKTMERMDFHFYANKRPKGYYLIN